MWGRRVLGGLVILLSGCSGGGVSESPHGVESSGGVESVVVPAISESAENTNAENTNAD
jgi:hypothetical protein